MSAPASLSAVTATHQVDVYQLGVMPYRRTLAAMHHYTANRGADDRDQIWLVQHPPVFTQGQAGRPDHLLDVGDIEVVQADRGGQVTYHGPGQLVAYVLFDIKRLGIGVRALVSALEGSIVGACASHNVAAYARPDAPGVYVDHPQQGEMKIASLGLRIRRGCSFHGVAYNIAMDLAPFLRIDPCGYAGMKMTQLSDWVSTSPSCASEAPRWLAAFAHALSQQGVTQRLIMNHHDKLPDSVAHTTDKPGQVDE
ncbi:lipoyl(octanoyl) transferase LipB [Carnimonas bestiolae]|uniref:lipoyl(octanoyl) transferase LipB n=1 Tax=Carnimonas bestiolae TaxID=3402172 RepID=UPI003EDB911A